MRYELDRLGWVNFEWLCQTLLKAEFSCTIQSWGGSRDGGRDAFARGDLRGQVGQLLLEGPVVFQAKFVSEANARGSDYRTPLLAACRAEAKAIKQRIQQGLWKEPSSYLLITNCPLTGSDRNEVEGIISQSTSALIFSWGVSDLSDLLDPHPEIARSYPQILNYRNLLDIISTIQSKDVLERTQAALAAAEEIIPVFVPTEAYDRAWSVLRTKHFVVLSGPPEMGKTSIGWMIAMSQLANGWHVIECSAPSEFFRTYDSKVKQLFIADDAFGRTEYNVDRGSLWEADLAKVLQRLDADHLLVWTSRKHILERAMKEIDIQATAAKFPKPAEVLVQAEMLSTKEKALILYRHAAAAGLDVDAKTILKENLEPLVSDEHFTPERIRRFVKFELPDLASQLRDGTIKTDEVGIRVQKAIEQYTDMMQKSFTKLPDDRKWLLISLLDERNADNPKAVAAKFATISPVVASKPIPELLNELDEAFIKFDAKTSDRRFSVTRPLTWVHPSYRDLVIDALNAEKKMAIRYLEYGGMDALTLALSQEGGIAGERSFPLLVDDECWAVFRASCEKQIEEGTNFNRSIILILFQSALGGAPHRHKKRLETLAVLICENIRRKWDDLDEEIDLDDLERFFELADRAAEHVESPRLDLTWDAYWERIRSGIFSEETDRFEEPEHFFNWASLLQILTKNEPRVLRRTGFPSISGETIAKIMRIAEADAHADVDFNEADEYTEEAERLRKVTQALAALVGVFPEQKKDIERAITALENQAERMDDRANDLRIPDYEPDHDASSQRVEIFDIKELFSDL